MRKKNSLATIVGLLADLTVFQSLDFQTFLKKLVKLLGDIIPVDSCLIYFYDRQKKLFILAASKKPHKKLIGKITLKEGEGITGWAAIHKETVVLKKNAYQDYRFKKFSELPEDLFEAFLSVPVVDKEGIVGVVNFQHKEPYSFTSEQIKTIEAVVRIISTAFEKVLLERKVDNLESRLEERKIVDRAKGLVMKVKNISEEEAYQFIRREAMNKRKTVKEIASAVILIYSE